MYVKGKKSGVDFMASISGLMGDAERLQKWAEVRNARSRQMLTQLCHNAPDVRGGRLTDDDFEYPDI
jgi:hypothetical protein